MSDREFLKLFGGLMGALGVLTVVLIILANLLGAKATPEKVDAGLAARIRPVGEVTVGPGNGMNLIATANAAGEDKGKAVYDANCAACHATGVAGAPKFGDKAAWKDRIAKGNAALQASAIKGFQGKTGFMPAKGGNASLSDADVKAAVDYMVAKSK